MNTYTDTGPGGSWERLVASFTFQAPTQRLALSLCFLIYKMGTMTAPTAGVVAGLNALMAVVLLAVLWICLSF